MLLRGGAALALLPRRATRPISFSRFCAVDDKPEVPVKKAKQKKATRDNVFVTMDTFAGSNFEKSDNIEPRDFRGIDIKKENLLDSVLGSYGLADDVKKDLEKAASFELASDKQIMKRKIAKTVEKYRRFPGDTGSTEVQVAVLSERIAWLREQMAKCKKNQVMKRTLELRFHQRRRLMKYLKRERFDKYNLMLVEYDMTEEEIWNWGHVPGAKKMFPRYRRGFSESRFDREKREKWEQEAKEAKESEGQQQDQEKA